ncbi:MAG: tRNA pseudouridine(38-40) synthase TruA [Alphaproteobacteria bacterium]|nr:tRNA pseudouridine(38-40) synthase TruA [Alphaproteobacteria bacterium]MBQ6995486.1 tRNA pseudouridine(38-40) synthase TruA [Lachnospiraceae bacterium]
MKNYKITIQYDGTRYKGWQVQKSTDMTIQGKIQDVLSAMTGQEIEVIGSGRTDAGVHAFGQVANFHIPEHFSQDEVLEYLNHYLPMDIAVLDIEEVEERFHARYHAVSKTYVYRIHTSTIPNVFERKYMYTYTEPLDVSKMREAANRMLGTHDFMAFCSNKKMKKSTVRTVTAIDIQEKENEIRISYTGDGFLQNMIRIMTGTLIEVGNGAKKVEDISQILESKVRENAGYTVPAEGLLLKCVNYE